MKISALLLLALALHARAKSDITFWTIAAGGGVQSSDNYVVNFTFGQTLVGSDSPSSANYQILPGFWALGTFGTDTVRPELSITLRGANAVLSWPSPSTGFVLQHTDSLNVLPPSWSDTSGFASDNGSIKSVVVPQNEARRFYRLRRP